jgi:predicted amidohydrolase
MRRVAGSHMSRPVTVGIAQITGDLGTADGNREATVRAAREAFDQGADVVVLPELIVSGYTTSAGTLASAAEALHGPTVGAWIDVARRADGLIVGGLCERDGSDLFNSAVLVDGRGVVAHYRKLHLFDREKEVFTPGDRGLPVVETRVGRLGLCICYDLRFVEVVRGLSLAGAELICVPTAWVVGFDRVRWDDRGLCPQAHAAIQQANLDQVFIACASQAGTRGPTELLGSSIVVDPFGQLVLGPLSGTDEAVTTATVDFDDVDRAQRRSPLITPRADRRTDVYAVDLLGRRL